MGFNSTVQNTGFSGSLASYSQLRTPLTVLSAILLILLGTYISTLLRFELLVRSTAATVTSPPIKPHWFPYLGSIFSFLTDPKYFFRELRQHGSIPIHVKLGPEEMVIVSGPSNLQTLFNKSRDLSTKALTMLTVVTCFGLPARDSKIFEDDDSGLLPKPLPGTNVAPESRVLHLTHRNFHYNLTGPTLEELSRQFIRSFARTIESVGSSSDDDWVHFPDLFGFIKRELFTATTTALCGEHILPLSPTMVDDFWEFDAWLPYLVRKMPRWMIPHAFRVRDRNIDNIMRWQEYARQHVDPAAEELKDVLWEPVWGAKVMRERAVFQKNLGSAMSERGHAAMDLGMIWGANGNSIPASAWSVFNVVANKSLVARVREEIAPAFSSNTLDSLDLTKLNACPLLQSVVSEVKRLYMTTLIHRTSIVSDFKLGRWLIKPGILMISSIWHAHHDEEHWNTGRTLPNGQPEHPLTEFWAERFLEYPNDPYSGPLKPSPNPSKPNLNPTASASHTSSHNPQDDQTACYVSGDKLKGIYIPWGGGLNMCPGRHYAKSEMMLAVAMMVWVWDVEFVDAPAAAATRASMAAFGVGMLGADREVGFRVRRRGGLTVDREGLC